MEIKFDQRKVKALTEKELHYHYLPQLKQTALNAFFELLKAKIMLVPKDGVDVSYYWRVVTPIQEEVWTRLRAVNQGYDTLATIRCSGRTNEVPLIENGRLHYILQCVADDSYEGFSRCALIDARKALEFFLSMPEHTRSQRGFRGRNGYDGTYFYKFDKCDRPDAVLWEWRA